RFMECALYHPEWGYYNTQCAIGREGDFTTAPEMSPLFAGCYAKQCLSLLDYGLNNVLELGAGTGRFARDLLQTFEQKNRLPHHYYIFEISPHLQKKQQ